MVNRNIVDIFKDVNIFFMVQRSVAVSVDMEYNVCVVGGGMIGSSAARHLQQSSHLQNILVGPSEQQVFV